MSKVALDYTDLDCVRRRSLQTCLEAFLDRGLQTWSTWRPFLYFLFGVFLDATEGRVRTSLCRQNVQQVSMDAVAMSASVPFEELGIASSPNTHGKIF